MKKNDNQAHQTLHTKQKIAEERPRESEEQCRSIIEISGEGILLTSPDGSIYSANPEASRIFGMTEDEICKAGRTGLVDPDNPNLESLLIERRKTGKFKGELILLRKNGEKFSAEVNSILFLDSSGNERTSMIIRDISERKKVEKEVNEARNRYQDIMDLARDVIFTVSPQGDLLFLNHIFEALTGWQINSWIGKPFTDILHPDDVSLASERFTNVINGKLSEPIELRLRKKSGEYLYGEIMAAPRTKDRTTIGLLGIARDITHRKGIEAALKQSEEKFRQLSEKSIIGISIIQDDKIVYANKCFANIFGYSEKEIIGILHTKDLIHPDDVLLVRKRLEARGEGKVTDRNLICRGIRKDSSRIYIEVNGTLIDFHGEHSVMGTLIDVTERMLAEEKLRKSEEELRNSKKLLEKLNQHQNEIRENERALISRQIHDELGQSLTALKLDMNQMRKYMNNNYEAVEKLEKMIGLVSSTIKNVQRISSDLRPGILDDLGLVAAIEWYCGEFEHRHGIKCNLELDDLDYHDSRINLIFFRVLQEVLTNVMRHARASYVNIALQGSQKGTKLVLHDNGIGISVKKIKSQSSLGLINIRERVRQFNGKISITSKKGEGTKLTIFIPNIK